MEIKKDQACFYMDKDNVPIFIKIFDAPKYKRNFMAQITYHKKTKEISARYRFRNENDLTRQVTILKTKDGKERFPYNKEVVKKISDSLIEVEYRLSKITEIVNSKSFKFKTTDNIDDILDEMRISDCFNMRTEETKSNKEDEKMEIDKSNK